MNYTNIITEIKSNIGYITINRPKQLNALNKKTIEELNHAIIDFEKNKTIKCLILTGAEKKAFVAGADIKEFMHFSQKDGSELARTGQKLLFNLLENLSKPTIAAINGFALGGGLELAMCCHIRVAALNAKMGLPEVSLGVIPGYGGTQRLTQLVGKGKSFEMITTGTMISAEEAQDLGLVNHICLQEQLMEKCEKIAAQIRKNSSKAISKAIKTINSGFLRDGFDEEIKAFGECFESDHFIEGTNAFIEKRTPNFLDT